MKLTNLVLVKNENNRVQEMSSELNSTDPSDPMLYQIRVESHLGPQWTDWFEGMTITLEENGATLLTGLVVDQAALHGLLKKVRDLGLPLLSLMGVKLDESKLRMTNRKFSQSTCGGTHYKEIEKERRFSTTFVNALDTTQRRKNDESQRKNEYL